MKCPACGAEAPPDSVFCPHCGTSLTAPSMAGAAAEHATATENFRENVHARQVPSDDIETEIWQGGYSPRAMVGEWIIAGLISIVAVAVAAMWLKDGLAWTIVLSAIAVLWLFLGLRLMGRRLGTHYRLTNVRFFHESGFLRRITERIEVIHIDDVTVSQGFIQRMMGVGNILVTSSDKISPRMVLVGIDHVTHVADMIDTVRRELRNRRGLRVEQI